MYTQDKSKERSKRISCEGEIGIINCEGKIGIVNQVTENFIPLVAMKLLFYIESNTFDSYVLVDLANWKVTDHINCFQRLLCNYL